MRSLVILPVMTVMALVQWGCAVARPRTVAPPSAEMQAQLGVIGVALGSISGGLSKCNRSKQQHEERNKPFPVHANASFRF